jgi:uncharacterized protein YecE (DUF72 family)
VARYWIGTSGWNYRHWRERFYPKGLAPRDWLGFYAEHFSTVEINYSHYRQPSAANWKTWRDGTPYGFRFAVKAHRYLTHLRRLKDPESSLKDVLNRATKLGEKLGPILYQLPPQFKSTPDTRDRLQAFLDLLPGNRMHAVEFRDKSWFGEDTLEALRNRGVAFCSFDRRNLTPPLVATAAFAYVRFHGSDDEPGGNYSEKDLAGWARRLEKLAREVDDLFVYFNNDAFGYAPANAAMIAGMLGQRTTPEPAVAAT